MCLHLMSSSHTLPLNYTLQAVRSWKPSSLASGAPSLTLCLRPFSLYTAPLSQLLVLSSEIRRVQWPSGVILPLNLQFFYVWHCPGSKQMKTLFIKCSFSSYLTEIWLQIFCGVYLERYMSCDNCHLEFMLLKIKNGYCLLFCHYVLPLQIV